jgi:anti-sigma B factor antagonist
VAIIHVDDLGKVKIIKIQGEFFLQFVRPVEEAWNSLITKGAEVIAIDCGELVFLDSSAIGTLVKLLNYANTHNIKLIFFDLSDSIVRIFNKAKLNKIFTILTRDAFEKSYLSSPE